MLPKGWVETDFVKINFHRSKSIDPRNEPENEYELYSVPSFQTGKPEIVKGKEIGSSKQVVEPRDVLVRKINPRINRVWEVAANTGRPQIASSEWIVMRSNSILSDYLRYQFSENNFRELICNDVTGVGGSLTRAQPKRVATYPVFIAPLPEQKRIAAKLDCLLVKVDSCKARLDKVPEIIKRFRQSVLSDAVSGKLTEDWREDRSDFDTGTQLLNEIAVARKSTEEWNYFNESWKQNKLPVSWDWAYLSEIAESKLGKMLDKRKNIGNRTKYLRNVNVRWFNFDLDDLLEMKATEKDRNKFCLKENDVLICEGGEPGRSAVWEKNNNSLIYQKALHRVRLKHGINPNWLVFNLKADADNNKLVALFTGTTIKHLTGQSLAKYPIAIPPTKEQSEIVRRVHTLFSFTDQLEEKLKTATKRIDKITLNILSKAFRGELVPQDPNDETAEVLLKRIRTEREALAANKRKGGRTHKKPGSVKKSKPQKADAEVEPEPAALKPAGTGIDKEKDREVVSRELAAKLTHKHFEIADVLKAYRKAIFRQNEIDEYTILRLVGQRLGVQRLSKPIRQELESCITTAIRRKIIARNGDGYDSATTTIYHYDEDYLIKILRSVMRNGYEYQRDYLMAETAIYLGFNKISDSFAERMKAIFRLAIRRGQIYRNGVYVGKV